MDVTGETNVVRDRARVESEERTLTYRVIALFSGGGGLNLGFRTAGFDTVLATDFEPTAAATFAHNLPEVPFHLGDVQHLTPSKIRELIGTVPVDVVIGGPPCQGFTTIGNQVQGDPRNSLFGAFARVVRWTTPEFVLIENTSYLRSQYAGAYEDEIRSELEALGYRVSVAVLNAADYGAPQTRKRIFFAASRDGREFTWPRPTHGPDSATVQPFATVGPAIMDIADVGASSLPNHIALRHSEKVLQRYRLIPEGGRMPPPQELPPEIRRRNFGNTYKRLHRQRPSLTLVPGNNAFPIHPTEDRSLTPREAARLQGFPDDYVFAGSRAEQCRLVGNAVPVHLARALADSVADHLSRVATAESSEQPIVVGEPVQLALPLAAPKDSAGSNGSPSAISLFTGAGGLLLGFRRAGFQVLSSYDRKSIVAENLPLNFPKIHHEKMDLTAVTGDELLRGTGGVVPDVIFGGPPCQGFSVFGNRRFVNTRGHRPETDLRNELTLSFLRVAVEVGPKVIFMENVKGFASTPRATSTYLDAALGVLESGGYQVSFRVINSADYGVPQKRERAIVVATRPGFDFEWPVGRFFATPRAWQRGWATVGDAISDLADDSTYSSAFSHVPMAHKPLVEARYRLIPEGGRLPVADLPDELRRGYRTEDIKNFSHVYRRLSRERPASTMVPGHNAFPVHPTLPRTLTVREAARIQTFPDWFRFVGTRQQQGILVGNAVPPLLAEVFAQAIAKTLGGNARKPGYKADHYELRALSRA